MKKNIKILGIILIIIIIVIIRKNRKEVVFVEKIKKQNYIEKIIASGEVQGEKEIVVISEIDGIVENIKFAENDLIEKDETIIKLKTNEINEKIKKAEFDYEKAILTLEKLRKIDLINAKSELESSLVNYKIKKEKYIKNKKLYEGGHINKDDYDLSKNEFSLARNRMEIAKNEVNSLDEGLKKQLAVADLKSKESQLKELREIHKKYYITLPYDVYLIKKNIEEGEIIKKNDELIEIVSDENKKVIVEIDEKYINRINLKNIVEIYNYGSTEIGSKGEVYQKGIGVDKDNGTVEVKISLENQDDTFLYGSSVDVIIFSEKFDNIFLVDNSKIEAEEKENFIYILKNKKIEKVFVEIKKVIDGNLILNLDEEEIFIFNIKDAKKDNIKIEVKESENEI